MQQPSGLSLSILDCLRRSFDEEVKRKGKNCTLPWIESMSALEPNDDVKISTCSNSTSVHLMSSVGHNFSKQLAKYNVTKCPGNSKYMIFCLDLITDR